MKFEFEELVRWNTGVEGPVLSGTADDRPVCLFFSGRVLAELFGVRHDPIAVRVAFLRNRELMEEIARNAVKVGKLDREGLVFLLDEDLLPYFERRATARA